MKIKRLLLAGAGFGLAALAFRRKRDCRTSIGEANFDRHDATLLGKKSYLTDIGGQSADHIKSGLSRSTERPTSQSPA